MITEKLICLKILNKKIDNRMIALALISTVLLLIRVKITHSIYLLFLLWNLFLAIIPYAISSRLKNNISVKRNNFLKLIYYFLWLSFIPNTFYLITDFVHLYYSSNLQFTFDAILLSTYSIAGFYIGIASLDHMHSILKSKYSNKISVFVVIIICYSCAFGIYLGRILRFNSWDIICHPIILIQSIIDCLSILDSYLFTIELGTLILVLYLAIHLKKQFMKLRYDFNRFSFSTRLALLCFCIGTLLLALFFLLPENDGIVITGLFFVVFATFFNGIMLLNLMYQWALNPEERENINLKIVILLSNIPIAILYLFLITYKVKNNSPF